MYPPPDVSSKSGVGAFAGGCATAGPGLLRARSSTAPYAPSVTPVGVAARRSESRRVARLVTQAS